MRKIKRPLKKLSVQTFLEYFNAIDCLLKYSINKEYLQAHNTSEILSNLDSIEFFEFNTSIMHISKTIFEELATWYGAEHDLVCEQKSKFESSNHMILKFDSVLYKTKPSQNIFSAYVQGIQIIESIVKRQDGKSI